MKHRFFSLLALCSLLCAAFLPVSARTSQFPVRAFHLDFRTEVMTLEAMQTLVDRLSAQGINTLVMEWEATFPFEKHATLSNEKVFTRDQVRDFVAYCARKGMDVIPLQNCFGHSEYILRNERYRALREDAKDPSQVCPLKIEVAKAVFSEIFADVASLHPSKYFHIGADETYLLGQCKQCRAVAEKEGKSKLFVDYVRAMCDLVHDMGKTPIIWADIILKYPEALDSLPKDLIYVDWNYGWEPDRFGKLDNLFARGAKMWGAPALRSGPDQLYLVQWKKHFDNLRVFVDYAREHNYGGMIETSWSTSGTYGYWYDNGYEVLNMQPVRLVYPMAGFRILEDACCAAFATDAPFEPEAFVRRYAQDSLGLNAAQADILWRYFCMPQEMVTVNAAGTRDAAGRTVPEVLADCEALRRDMETLPVGKKGSQIAHLNLMLDIRINYLKFKAVEAEYQASSFSRAGFAPLRDRMQAVLREAAVLDKRFARLHKSYLKAADIDYLNQMRSVKMIELYHRLTQNTDEK